MKKQVIKTLFFFVVMAIIGLTCKKYPEGPLISLRSAEKRIIGKWEIKEVKINGHDKINDIDSLAIDYYHFYLSEYCKSKRGTDEWCPELYVEIIDKKELKLILFSWGLNDKKRNISFSKFSYSFPVNSPPPTTWPNYGIPCLVDGYETWTIIRLTKKELKLEIKNSGNLYEVFLKKI